MKVGTLRTTHPDYDGPRIAQWEALYHGGKRWDLLVANWLPQHPNEPKERYDKRLAMALYHNNVGPIIDLIVAGLFSQSPNVQNWLTDEWATNFQKDCNGEGTSLELWCAQLLTEALIGQRAYAWANLPERDPGIEFTDLGAELKSGQLDAFLVQLTAEHVIDWGRDARGRLTWVMIHDCVEERESIEVGRVKVWRWTYIDKAVIRRWTWRATDQKCEPDADDMAQEQEPINHTLGQLPIVELRLPSGLHAGGKLHHPAVAHLRSRNDLSWALFIAAHPLLAIKARHKDLVSRPILGPGSFLKLAQDDDIGYVEPAGTSFQLLAENTDKLREDLYRVVQQMSVGLSTSASKQAQSGESKNADWRALETVLSALAARVKPFLSSLLSLVAKMRGQEVPKLTISGLEGWQEEELTLWLQAAAMALEASRMSPTFRKEMAKRQARRLLGNAPEVLKVVDAEIDEAPDEIDILAPLGPKPHPDGIQAASDLEAQRAKSKADQPPKPKPKKGAKGG